MQNKLKSISCIIPIYKLDSSKNWDRFLILLDSLAESIKLAPTNNFEIIIVNDDPLLDKKKEINEKLVNLGLSSVSTILTNSENRGQAYSRNIGADSAKNEYLHFIDQDDFINKSFYTAILSNSDKDIYIARPMFFIESTQKKIKAITFITKFMYQYASHLTNLWVLLASNIVYSPGQAVIRKSKFDSIGGFPILKYRGSDDYAFFYNLTLKGKLTLSYIDSSIFLYRIHGDQNSKMLNMHASINEFFSDAEVFSLRAKILRKIKISKSWNLFAKLTYILLFKRVPKQRRVLFYSSVSDINLFKLTGFYTTDIKILEECGNTVTTTNKAIDFLKFWKYDVAFIYFYRFGLIPAIIAKAFIKNVIFTGGIDALDAKFMSSNYKDYIIQKWLYIFCSFFSDKNIIVSSTDMQNIRSVTTNIKKASILPHVIDFENYQFDFRVKKNTIVSIVWMGTESNVRRKGVDKLLHVFECFCKLNSDFELIIVGTIGEGTTYLNNILSQMTSKDKVKFTNTLEEKRKIEILKNSKYYFQLSDFEGFGIAAIEAMASGNIVFHTGNGGLKDAAGDSGVLIDDPCNYEEVARILDQIESRYSDYNDLIQKGTKYIESKFQYEIRKTGFQSILNSF